jgi:hypothetical protein
MDNVELFLKRVEVGCVYGRRIYIFNLPRDEMQKRPEDPASPRCEASLGKCLDQEESPQDGRSFGSAALQPILVIPLSCETARYWKCHSGQVE